MRLHAIQPACQTWSRSHGSSRDVSDCGSIAAQLVAPVDLSGGRVPRFALHGGDLAVDGVPRRGVAVRQIIGHTPLPYDHQRIARDPADAAFVPAHEEPIPAHQPPIRDQTEQRELLGHDQIAMRGNVPEIGLGNIRVAMPRQQGLKLSRLRSPVQPDLVRLAAGGKNPQLHPPLQHQPIAEIHPINSFANTQRARCHTCHANRSMLRRSEQPTPDLHAQTRGCNQR